MSHLARNSQGQRKPPTREQAQAWIRHLLQPLVQDLMAEEDRLSRRWLSWESLSGQFEALRTVADYLDFDGETLLRQLLRYEPHLGTLVGKHDRGLLELQRVARELQEALERDAAFRAAVDAAASKYGSEWHNLGPEGHSKVAAELVVNGVSPAEDIPSLYRFKEFWSRFGESLLDHVSRSTHETKRSELQHLRQALDESARGLRVELERLRDALADAHGLPAGRFG